MRKIHECAEDIKNILNDAERTENCRRSIFGSR